MFQCLIVNDKNKILKKYDGYVPSFMPGQHYGDYIDLEIDVKTGKILNWNSDAVKQVKAFLKE